MGVRRRFWWITGTLIMCGIVLLIFVAYRFGWSKTGFLNKTLWDWMQLLIVPVVLGAGALLFNYTTSHNDQRITEQRYQNDQRITEQRYQDDQKIAQQRYHHDQEIAIDKQREDLLQAYFDRLTELLLKENLRKSKSNDEVCNVARARTLTVLSRLDSSRKSSLLQFLSESDLIRIISFSGANLDGVHLEFANLECANLEKATLVRANLSFSQLTRAILNNANLTEAKLAYVQLQEASMLFTNLNKAVLYKADLKGAKLDCSDLSEASLDEADW